MSKQNGRKGAPGLRQQLCEDTRVRRALFINRKLVAWVQVGRTNRWRWSGNTVFFRRPSLSSAPHPRSTLFSSWKKPPAHPESPPPFNH